MKRTFTAAFFIITSISIAFASILFYKKPKADDWRKNPVDRGSSFFKTNTTDGGGGIPAFTWSAALALTEVGITVSGIDTNIASEIAVSMDPAGTFTGSEWRPFANSFTAAGSGYTINTLVTLKVRFRNGRESAASSKYPLPAGVIYVSTLGDNFANNGLSAASPIQSLQLAVNKVRELGYNYIYITGGVYTRTTGLNNANQGLVITNLSRLHIIGGWNASFTDRPASTYSIFDNTGNNNTVIYMSAVSSNTLEGIVVRNGGGNFGAGIYLSDATNCTVTNCVISNNSAVIAGGGICLTNAASNIAIHANIAGNTSGSYGGGVYAGGTGGHRVAGFLSNNSANMGGGIYAAAPGLALMAAVAGNSASNGGGVSMMAAHAGVISGPVFNNTATNGGGIMIAFCSNTTVTGDITGNTASNASALLDMQTSNTMISARILGNASTGGITIVFASNTNAALVSSVVTNNTGGANDILLLLMGADTTLISNNLFAAVTNTNAVALYELNAVSGHRILNNTFYSELLFASYRDSVNSYIIPTSNWQMINSNSFMGTIGANGNIYLPPLDGSFVSLSGSDANTGISRLVPVRTIQQGVYIAASNGLPKVYVSAGIYTQGSGLLSGTAGLLLTNSGIAVLGGWGNSFVEQTNVSVLDGRNNLCHVVAVSNITNVSMERFVITGGAAGAELTGGGMQCTFATNVVISNCSFLSNTASNGAGVWFASSSNCILADSSICNNTALASGGGMGLSNSRGMSVRGNSFIGNAASNGGGISLFSCMNALFTNCIFATNAAVEGAGIYAEGLSGSVINGAVFRNTASLNGAGFLLRYSDSNTLQLFAATNSAVSNGGGGFIDCGFGNSITGVFYSNAAGTGAGGLYVSAASNMLINAAVRMNKTASGSGPGGVYLIAGVSNTISGDISCHTNTNSIGGGVRIENSRYTVMSNCTIQSNYAYRGGGLSMLTMVGTIITGCAFTNNYAYSGSGGGMNISQAVDMVITNCSLKGNYGDYGGGGIMLDRLTNIVISAVSMIANAGDGMTVQYVSNLTITAVTCSMNYNGGFGGGIILTKCSGILMSNVFISSNRSSGGGLPCSGGGMYIERCADALFDVTVCSNYALHNAGGMMVRLATNIVIAGSFFSNYASANGGGLFVSNSTSNVTIRAAVTKNRAINGGGIYLDGMDYTVSNTIVMSNTASSSGGGIYIVGGPHMVTNAVIASNTATYDGGGCTVYGSNNTISAQIIGNTVSLQHATSWDHGGGGVFMEANNCTILPNTVMASNVSAGPGGGLFVHLGASHNVTGTYLMNTPAGVHTFYGTSNTFSNLIVYGNYPLAFSTSKSISNVVINSVFTGNSNGMFISNTAYLTVTNCAITNNGGTDAIALFRSQPEDIYGLVLAGNLIGCASTNGTAGIAEYGTNDIFGQVIRNNQFGTNYTQYLYRDYLNAHIVTNDASCANINDTNYSGAETASGNTVAVW
ncbi:MAG: right-handed parallel beta-helix repeat-containing protein [Spirochaetes bacterium]|nr:right-handed parallel beta-helix repeat-containing protein [Spirochaetota bacterium]